jgi:hypothetical protein
MRGKSMILNANEERLESRSSLSLITDNGALRY